MIDDLLQFIASRKTHIMFVIRDYVDTKPLDPIANELQNLVNSVVSVKVWFS
jgi:hypothetical protein